MNAELLHLPLAGHTRPADWLGRDAGLTPRESDVILLIAHGISNQEIADQVYLSINSIKSIIRAAYRVMDVDSRTQAVLWAIEHGFRPDLVARAAGTVAAPVLVEDAG